jgi:hypothetical protein
MDLFTAENLAVVHNEILRTRTKRSERNIYSAIDIAKAYDSVNHKKLFFYLDGKVQIEKQRQILNLIKSLY